MFLAVSSFFSLMLILGTSLITFSIFTKLSVGLAFICSLVLCLILFYKKIKATTFSYYCLAIFILGIIFYANYSTITIGGQDPGTYVSYSGTLANYGTYYNPDHQIKIDKDDSNILYKETDGQEPIYNGIKRNQDKLYTSFLISPSVLLAEAFLFFPRDISFLINSIFCILASFAFFYFCKEIFDEKTSFSLTLLLMLCPAQIHFGKASYTEIPAQFFIFLSLLFLIHFNKKFLQGSKLKELSFLAILTSLFLNCACLYRSEIFLLSYLIILLIPFMKPSLEKDDKLSLIIFQLIILFGILLVYISNGIISSTNLFLIAKGATIYIKHSFWFGLAFFLISLSFYEKKTRNFLSNIYSFICEKLHSENILCFLSLLIIFFLSCGFVYRIMALGFHKNFWPSAHAVVETMNEMIFHRVSVLTGVPIFIASFFGIIFFIKNKASSYIAFYALILFYFAYASRLFFVQSNSPQLYWAVRRYLPCMVPAIIFFGAFALCNLKLFKKDTTNAIFAIGMYIISILPMTYFSLPLISHSDMKGAIKFTQKIEKNFDKSSTVFIGDYENKNILQQLKFLGGYDVYMIPSFSIDGKLNKEKENPIKNLISNLKKEKKEGYFIFINKPMSKEEFERKLYFNFSYKRLGEEKINYPRTFSHLHNKVQIGKLK